MFSVIMVSRTAQPLNNTFDYHLTSSHWLLLLLGINVSSLLIGLRWSHDIHYSQTAHEAECTITKTITSN